MSHRLKPTPMENKRFIMKEKLLPYFGNLKVCDVDTIGIQRWQNEWISCLDEAGNPFSQTYRKTVNNLLSAIMNYGGPLPALCQSVPAADSMGKSRAEEMNIWNQEQYEQFSAAIQKSSAKLAFDALFYTGMQSGELLALPPVDILP